MMRAVVRRADPGTSAQTARRHGIRLAEKPARRRRGDYPWDVWQDGGWHLIRQGRDFDASVEGMRSTLFTRAMRDGLRIEVIRNPEAPEVPASKGRLHLAFCFYADADSDPAAV